MHFGVSEMYYVIANNGLGSNVWDTEFCWCVSYPNFFLNKPTLHSSKKKNPVNFLFLKLCALNPLDYPDLRRLALFV
jgi:hypothetical protein